MGVIINIDVADFEKAIAFYTSALDLTLARRLFDGTVAELTGAGATIQLLEKAPGSAAVPGNALTRSYARHWTPVHLDFTVEDIDASVQRALASGAKLEGGVDSFPWGRLATMSDPFGNGFCLVQLQGEGYT